MSSESFFGENATTPTKFNFPAVMLHRFLRLEGLRLARSSFELCPLEGSEGEVDPESCLCPPIMVQKDDPFAVEIPRAQFSDRG